MAQLVECLTLGFNSGRCELRVMRSSPASGSMLSVESAPPLPLLPLSRVNKSLKKNGINFLSPCMFENSILIIVGFGFGILV